MGTVVLSDERYLLTALFRYLVDEKKLLTQGDVDAVMDKAEEYRKKSEEDFAKFSSMTPVQRRKELYGPSLHVVED